MLLNSLAYFTRVVYFYFRWFHMLWEFISCQTFGSQRFAPISEAASWSAGSSFAAEAFGLLGPPTFGFVACMIAVISIKLGLRPLP